MLTTQTRTILLLATLMAMLQTTTAKSFELSIAPAINSQQAALDFFVMMREDPEINEHNISVDFLPPLDPHLVIDFVASGQYSFGMLNIRDLAGHNTEDAAIHALMLSQPLLFSSQSENILVQESHYGQLALAEMGTTDFFPLGYWNGAGTSIVARQYIDQLDDLVGLRVAAQQDLTGQSAMNYVGMDPTQIMVADVSIAFESGILDAAELFNDEITSRGDWEIGSVAYFKPAISVVIVGVDFWEALTERQRQLLGRVVDRVLESNRETIVRIEEELVEVYDWIFTDITLSGEQRASYVENFFGGYGGRSHSAQGYLDQVRFHIDQLLRREDVLEEQLERRGDTDLGVPAERFVLFATDRRDEGSAESWDTRFGTKQRSIPQKVSCGLANYTIGEASSFIDIDGLTNVSNESDCVPLIREVWSEGGRDMLIFIHGYNNSFRKALMTAISIDMIVEHNLLVLFWAWPSLNSAGSYVADGSRIDESRTNFFDFLQDIVGNSEHFSIDVVAHSMGSRLLYHLIDVGGIQIRKKLRNLIFAAPDVDAAGLGNLASRRADVGKIRTLYASQYDGPIYHSGYANEDRRAGFGGEEVLVAENMDTVDVSALHFYQIMDGKQISPHSYAFETPRVMMDLAWLLTRRERADERGLPTLRNIYGQEYYIIPPED